MIKLNLIKYEFFNKEGGYYMSKSKNKDIFELGNAARKSNPDYREYIRTKEEENEPGFTSTDEYSNLQSKDDVKD
jgi:hypothetical protein